MLKPPQNKAPENNKKPQAASKLSPRGKTANQKAPKAPAANQNGLRAHSANQHKSSSGSDLESGSGQRSAQPANQQKPSSGSDSESRPGQSSVRDSTGDISFQQRMNALEQDEEVCVIIIVFIFQFKTKIFQDFDVESFNLS